MDIYPLLKTYSLLKVNFAFSLVKEPVNNNYFPKTEDCTKFWKMTHKDTLLKV